MLCVIEDHIDRLVLQNDFLEGDNIFVRYLSVELFTACRIRSRSSCEQSTVELTAISRIALWLMPVYVTTSPSLSGLNFLIAYMALSDSTLCAL